MSLNNFFPLFLSKIRRNFNKKDQQIQKKSMCLKERNKFILNAIHNKNTCGYNDDRL